MQHIDRTVINRTQAQSSQLSLLAVMEATTVTGAAKSMLDFCRNVRDLQPALSDLPIIKTAIVTFDRRRANIAPPHQETNQSGGEGASSNTFVERAREIGVEVEVIEERFRFDLRVIPGLRKAVEKHKPDIILTHHVKSHFLMKCSRLWQKYPWIAFHHGYTATDLKMRAYNYLDRWSLPTADGVITVCQAFAKELANAGVPRERISVQHNSISAKRNASIEEVQALRVKLDLGKDERLVLAIGRLSREKAHLDLVTAFGHLRRGRPEINARLVIIGDGPERGQLEATAASLNIGDRTIFTGQLSNIDAYYALADLMVLPSHSEGSPYVLLEAMAAGVPVVATAVGGVPEMVEDKESALLVPAHSPQQIAEAISRVLTDPHLARLLTENASALVATRYSPESYVRSLLEIYQRTRSNRIA